MGKSQLERVAEEYVAEKGSRDAVRHANDLDHKHRHEQAEAFRSAAKKGKK